MQPINLPYTICFCIDENKLLMLHRNKAPNKNLWNGIGGKIEPNENPKESIIREVKEEAGIELKNTNALHFAGIVTWENAKETEPHTRGMYAYIAQCPSYSTNWNKKEINEGILEWKPLEWVLNKNNQTVVENIPCFLPLMLKNPTPAQYHCIYKGETLKAFSTQKLSQSIH